MKQNFLEIFPHEIKLEEDTKRDVYQFNYEHFFFSTKLVNIDNVISTFQEDINHIKEHKEKFKLFKVVAQRLGIHEFKINQIKQLKDLFHLIIKYNNIFPRSSELVIERVPTYTGSKFLILEPKNSKISRLEFFYLLLTSLENAYKSNIDKKESGKKKFINLLKNIHNYLNESDLEIIKELLKDFKIESFYNTLFNPVDYNEIFYNFDTIISNIKNKIELKSYKIRNNCQLEQKDLTGKLINEEFFLFLEDLDFL